MSIRGLVAALAATVLLAAPGQAQQRAGVMGDLAKDVVELQSKLTGLAKALPADKYDWRPAADVRSVGEVFLHIGADNYLMPAAVGFAPDPASGISATDFSTLTTFEKQKLSREAVLASMEKSFSHLLKAMNDTPDSRMDERVKFFGQDMSVRQVWIATTTHLHEHLGQAIAYARVNGVKPPWSK